MGQMIACCGHEITFEEMEKGQGWLEERYNDLSSEELMDGVTSGVYCPACLKKWRRDFAKGKKKARELGFI